VQRVQQWNEALKSPSKPSVPKHARVRSPSPTPLRGSDYGGALTFKLASPPARSRSSSAGMAGGLPFIPLLPPSALGNPAPAVARPVAVPEAEEPTDNWDDDFEDDITLTKLQMLEKVVPIPEIDLVSIKTAAVSGQGIFSRKSTPKKKALAAALGIGHGTPDADDVNSRTIRPTPTQSPTTSTKHLPSIFKPPPSAEPVPPLPTIVTPMAPQPTAQPLKATANAKVDDKPKMLSMGSVDESYDDLGDEEEDLFGKVESFKVGVLLPSRLLMVY
jgi:hypothetical protein